MSKSKDWWRVALSSVGTNYRYHQDADGTYGRGGYRAVMLMTLDRQPGRNVYLELSVGQAERLRDRLSFVIEQAKAQNTRDGIQTDPLDKRLDDDAEF